MIEYIARYNSPLGNILLEEDEEGLCGLWFEESVSCPVGHDKYKEKDTPLLLETSKWLDIYFSGKDPGFIPPLHIKGTEFQMKVWAMLLKIEYGKTVTYGEISSRIAGERGIKKMSAQAVGRAVGSNKISLIIPCHRVIGEGGKLVGYGGGLGRKKSLLALEGIYDSK